MQQIYYVWKTLLYGRAGNLIKVVSLGLGLTMSILLFCNLAYNQSIDTCFKEYDNLYQLWTKLTVADKTHPESYNNVGKLAGGVFEALPDVVESATSTGQWMVGDPLYYGDVRFDDYKIAADSLFFKTMGINVLSGNPVQDLQQKDVIYLSRELSERMFGGENPIGKVISYDRRFELTVKGVYETIPNNSTMKPKAVVSMPSVWSRNVGNYSWNGGDSWNAYIRIKPGTDIEQMNKRINLMVKQHVDDLPGFNMEISAKPIRDTFRGREDAKRMAGIMLVLALSILFITTLNYVLISISSLSRRAKSIGVHKCSGAEESTVFGMFLCETAIIIIAAMCIAGVLLWSMQDIMEEIVGNELSELFAFNRLGVPLCVVGTLFFVGGVLPGMVFPRIPVTQVFRRYTESKKGWKHPLLFIQFAGVTFIFGILVIVMMQYHFVLNKDVGFNPERIVLGAARGVTPLEEVQALKRFIEDKPYVEAFTSSLYDPTNDYSGELMYDDSGNVLFTSKWDYVQDNYAEVLEIAIKQGRIPRESGEVAVNEKWLEMRNWTSNQAIGKMIQTEESIEKVKIVGVIKDFHFGSFFNEQLPFVMHHFPENLGVTLYVRLKEPFVAHMDKLNKEVKEAFPVLEILFESMEQKQTDKYISIRIFRNSVMMAFIVILFMTLMGLIGYTNDEMNRRSKEIAIRKVNGAEAFDIIRMLTHDVLLIAFPAIVIACIAAWYVGEIWISQFAVTMEVVTPYYIFAGVGVLIMIIACVVIKTWRIANENPVESIKSE